MKIYACVRSWATALLALSLVAGCATMEQQKVVYPTPPEIPRFEWLGTFFSEADFKKEGLARVASEFAGGVPAGSKFHGPVGVAQHRDGRFLVSDLYDQNIKVLDLEQKKISVFGSMTFRNIIGIDVDQQGQIYVADSKAGEVQVLSVEGKLLRTIGDQEVFTRPTHLAINDQLGRLYVGDAAENRIFVFSLEGELLFSFRGEDSPAGPLYGPQGMAFDQAGRLFVADRLNARIQVFSAEGEYLEHFGERGLFAHQFENPKGLAFDSEGNLYVVDSRRPDFRVFTPDGVLLLKIGGDKPTDHKLGFHLPTSIYVDPLDRVFITDLLNHRVTVWQYLSAAHRARQEALK